MLCKLPEWTTLSKYFLFFKNKFHIYLFFSEQPFYGNYSAIGSDTNTVISHAVAYSSKTVIRPWKRSIVFKIVQVVVTFMSFVAISSVLPVACENFTGPHQFSGLSSHESPVG